MIDSLGNSVDLGKGETLPSRDTSGIHPPFGPGNAAALRHGAYSPRVYEPCARALVESAMETVPYLRQDSSFLVALWAWAVAEARCRLLTAWLIENGDLDPDGKQRDASKALLAWQRRASEERDRLGLNPLARAKLEQALSSSVRDRVDTVAALEHARQARLDAERAGGDPQGDGAAS